MFPLSAAVPRQLVRVVDTFGCGKRRLKLAAMGLTTGVEIKVCGAMGGPVVVEVRGSRLSLGRGVADKVLVRAIGDAGHCECEADRVCLDDGGHCECEADQVCLDDGGEDECNQEKPRMNADERRLKK